VAATRSRVRSRATTPSRVRRAATTPSRVRRAATTPSRVRRAATTPSRVRRAATAPSRVRRAQPPHLASVARNRPISRPSLATTPSHVRRAQPPHLASVARNHPISRPSLATAPSRVRRSQPPISRPSQHYHPISCPSRSQTTPSHVRRAAKPPHLASRISANITPSRVHRVPARRLGRAMATSSFERRHPISRPSCRQARPTTIPRRRNSRTTPSRVRRSIATPSRVPRTAQCRRRCAFKLPQTTPPHVPRAACASSSLFQFVVDYGTTPSRVSRVKTTPSHVRQCGIDTSRIPPWPRIKSPPHLASVVVSTSPDRKLSGCYTRANMLPLEPRGTETSDTVAPTMIRISAGDSRSRDHQWARTHVPFSGRRRAAVDDRMPMLTS
jgi:hypothetical protein